MGAERCFLNDYKLILHDSYELDDLACSLRHCIPSDCMAGRSNVFILAALKVFCVLIRFCIVLD